MYGKRFDFIPNSYFLSIAQEGRGVEIFTGKLYDYDAGDWVLEEEQTSYAYNQLSFIVHINTNERSWSVRTGFNGYGDFLNLRVLNNGQVLNYFISDFSNYPWPGTVGGMLQFNNPSTTYCWSIVGG